MARKDDCHDALKTALNNEIAAKNDARRAKNKIRNLMGIESDIQSIAKSTTDAANSPRSTILQGERRRRGTQR
ncbi:MAG: hypothetical protein QNJ97_17805 [Myxococcota bacterium]|nr:hypothetical protein [Myxococcota bacterium]